MPIEVCLPQLGEATTTAKLGAWLKREGEAVIAGEPIAEVSEILEVEFPVGHRKRRAEAVPLLTEKFRRNVLRRFSGAVPTASWHDALTRGGWRKRRSMSSSICSSSEINGRCSGSKVHGSCAFSAGRGATSSG